MGSQDHLTKTIRLTPEKWVSNGFCIAHHEGKSVFLTGAIPGVESGFHVEKEKSKHLYARAESVASDCRAFPQCGGCSYRHISYEEEIEIKKNELLSAFQQTFPSPDSPKLRIITGSIENYRNNVQWQESQGRIGFHERFSNQIVDLSDIGCKNLHPLITIPNRKSPRHLRISENEIAIPYMTKPTVFSTRGKSFSIPAGGFMQVNSELIPLWLEYIENQIKSYITGKNNPDALELFCGSGMIGQSISHCIGKFYGIEAIPSSIASAKSNAKWNDCSHFQYKTLDLYRKLPSSLIPKAPLWIINPPRMGAGKNVIQLWSEHKPDLILYSSCDAQTLARDWKELGKYTDDYRIDSLALIDFFPRTKHFETIIVFRKKDFQEW